MKINFKKMVINPWKYKWCSSTMTTVDSLYWGCYYIKSLIESFELTYRLIMIFKCGG